MYPQSTAKAYCTTELVELLSLGEADTKLHPLATLSYLVVAVAAGGGCAALHAIF